MNPPRYNSEGEKTFKSQKSKVQKHAELKLSRTRVWWLIIINKLHGMMRTRC
jgi:hypothetical protein